MLQQLKEREEKRTGFAKIKAGVILPVLLILVVPVLLCGCMSKALQAYAEAEELLAEENYEEAIDSLKLVVDSAKNDEPEDVEKMIESMYLIGDCYHQLGDDEAAKAAYDAALAEDLKEREFSLDVTATRWLRRGLIYRDRGDMEDALAAFTAGIALPEKSCDRELRYNEIYCLEQLGDYEAARDRLTSYVADYPDDEEAQKELAFLSTR